MSSSMEKALSHVILNWESSFLHQRKLSVRASSQGRKLQMTSFTLKKAHRDFAILEESPLRGYSYQLQILTKISSESPKIRLWIDDDKEIIKLLQRPPSCICSFLKNKKRDGKLCTFFTCHRCIVEHLVHICSLCGVYSTHLKGLYAGRSSGKFYEQISQSKADINN
jgi:hypothetical protein